ncbi:MAG TPA: GAF domain-containing sensor histidine kinase, partial [Ktedonobacteraceae bacterium]
SYLACPVVVQVYRYRRVSNVVQRQQTKWVVFGLTVAIAGFLGLLLLTATVSPTGKNNALAQLIVVSAYYLFFLLIPLTIGIAILRYRLYDIDIIVNRSLVYLALTICVVGIYVLIVVALGNLLQVQGNLWLSLGATCLVAVLFQPLRTRLQRAVNRLMYGERDDPYGVLSRLGQRLGGTLAPQAILPTLVETVAQALKLPYVAIRLKEDDALTVSHGTPTQTSLSLPLLYQGETIGEMLLAPRSPGERFSGPDRHLLEDLAHQAGIAVHAVLLTMALQRSRERLVKAREEERRRLRRDLHDGLGPTLGALTLKIGSTRALYPDNPDAADTLMEELETDIMTAVADIRRLVYALRPPALDELGLIAALRGCTLQFGFQKKAERGAEQVDHLHISIEAPAQLPPLPAAVEVAAYRIVQEALTNVARHAHARNCVIRIVLADSLQVEILDDGTGLPALQRSGVGLTSMRERAEELGGICEIETRPTGGTRVLATLPLQRPGWQSFGVERPLHSEAKE